MLNKKKAGKAKKRRRRRREEFVRLHFNQKKLPKDTPVFIDEPELSAEELRLRAIERAKEARKKGD